jgi:toxin HigB-1
VIESFGDKMTEDFYRGVSSAAARRVPASIRKAALIRLDAVEFAVTLDDLRIPPGNRLEALKGDLAGYHSIRINDQWRIVFRWEDDRAHGVRITDYHA